MYSVIVKLKTTDPEKWDNWNKATFNMRNEIGLVSIHIYQNMENKSEYVVISNWKDYDLLKKYMEDPNIKNIFNEKDVISYEIYEYLKEYSIEK